MKRLIAVLAAGMTLGLPVADAQQLQLRKSGRRPSVPTRPAPKPQQITMKYLGVKTTVSDQVATTEIDQTFHNPNGWQAEGTYLFPLPEGTTISNFKMYMGGKAMKADVLDADKARTIYRNIVRQRRDPGLLEFVGHRLLKASVFPIPAKGDVRIKVAFTRVLKADEGWFEFNYPLSSAGKKIDEVNFDVTLTSKTPIKSIYSPTHKVHTDRKSDREVRIRYEKTNLRPERSFSLLYSTSAADLGLNALAHRPEGEKGYFMVAIAPKVELTKEEIVAKSIIFVLDTSGSMAGPKMKQAREALSHCIKKLEDNATFNIVRFSTEVEALTEQGLLPADAKNKKRALSFVDDFEAAGGTNIDEALELALQLAAKKDGLTEIVFITDGKPTIGERDGDSILKNVAKANKYRARMFVFGVGDNLNTHLLDRLADDHRGARQYVAEGESIERKISNFYAKIAAPVLTGLKLDFGGLDVKHVYPKHLPDLFAGTQLLVFGRYKGDGGARAITLTGKVGGKAKKFVYETTFAKVHDDNAFLPRLWAQRKVGHLLDQLRLHGGANHEMKAEVIALARQYGIITPYTAGLVLEQKDRHLLDAVGGVKNQLAQGGPRGKGRVRQLGRPNRGVKPGKAAPAPPAGTDGGDAGAATEPTAEKESEGKLKQADARKAEIRKADEKLAKKSGKDAVELSKAVKRLRESKNMDDEDQARDQSAGESFGATTGAGARSERGRKAPARRLRKIADKTFVLQNGFYVDTKLLGAKKETLAKAVEVEYLSDAYFDLIAKHKRLGQYLKVGEKVLIQVGAAIYKVAPKAAKKKTEKVEKK